MKKDVRNLNVGCSSLLIWYCWYALQNPFIKECLDWDTSTTARCYKKVRQIYNNFLYYVKVGKKLESVFCSTFVKLSEYAIDAPFEWLKFSHTLSPSLFNINKQVKKKPLGNEFTSVLSVMVAHARMEHACFRKKWYDNDLAYYISVSIMRQSFSWSLNWSTLIFLHGRWIRSLATYVVCIAYRGYIRV